MKLDMNPKMLNKPKAKEASFKLDPTRDAEGYIKGQNPHYGPHLNSVLADLRTRDADGNITSGPGSGRPYDPSMQHGFIGGGIEALRNSASVVARALQGVKNNGTQMLLQNAQNAAQQSMMSRLTDGPEIDPDEDLPTAPGFAYMTHLFKHSQAGKKIKDKQRESITKGLNIMTNAMDGVRTAVKMIGLAAETNADGLPIDLKDAFKMFHGDKELDDISKNEFIRELQDGTTKIDRKKIRKFVNHDGSLTWEVLNDDKSIMSRFTMGEYNGTKIFAQGGYKHFADLMRQARAQLGEDYRGEFDAIRRSF